MSTCLICSDLIAAGLAVEAGPVVVGVAETCGALARHQVTADADCTARLAEAGAVPFVLARTTDPAVIERQVARLDALLLSGGVDVDPMRYGERPDPKLETVNSARDAFEWALLDAAVRHGIPVAGICRGAQVLNVYFGGSLYQDIFSAIPGVSSSHRSPAAGVYVNHLVTAERDSVLARLAGATEFSSNSRHHQAVKRLAKGFRITGRAPDGVVEAIESERVIGVQFHPERLRFSGDEAFSRHFFAELVKWFGEKSRKETGR